MKSHVSLEQNQCVICGKVYDTGNILLDRRIKDTLEQPTCTGWGICPEHQAKLDEGYIALLECKSKFQADSTLEEIQALRTETYAFLRKSIAAQLFKNPPKDDLLFVEVGVIEELQQMQEQNV